MLTFEEFFKRKKIDLAALQQDKPDLFTEFASHYDEMGEKSFDHVKKYWFNKLRKTYHLAPEVKTEPIRNENQLAEQTIIDSLSAPAEAISKPGFTPRFKAGAPKPAEAASESEATPEKPAETAAPKPGFTPRFKANVTKPAEPAAPTENTAEKATDEQPAAPKGFTPRFKAGVTKPAEPATPAENKEEKTGEEAPATPTPKGFTPRFKAGVTKPAEPAAPVEGTTAQPAEDKPETPAPKGFTPRFKAGVTKTAQPEEPAVTENIPEAAATPEQPTPAPPTTAAPKGFTPRFKAGITKTAQPEQSAAAEDMPEAATVPEQTTVAEKSKEEAQSPQPATAAPKGFTPRFKAGVTKPVTTDKPAVDDPAPVPAPVKKIPIPKIGSVPPETADVPEFDFTGKPASAPVDEQKSEDKIDKLAGQADRLASDFKNKFKATHLPKAAPRLKPGESAPEEQPAPPAAEKSEEKKLGFKPRFNVKKTPPKAEE